VLGAADGELLGAVVGAALCGGLLGVDVGAGELGAGELGVAEGRDAEALGLAGAAGAVAVAAAGVALVARGRAGAVDGAVCCGAARRSMATDGDGDVVGVEDSEGLLRTSVRDSGSPPSPPIGR